MKRRTFLFSGALSTATYVLMGRIAHGAERIQEKFSIKKSNFWQGNYFHQFNVDTSKVKDGIIRAKIRGKWEKYQLREVNDSYLDWNMKDRLSNLSIMRGGKMPDWSGAHNAAVATYGKNRGDSRFSLNNAIKGTGLYPKNDRIEGLITKFKESWDQPIPEKLNVLESMYKDKTLWDRSRLISLELYATPDFETHTFLNQMENPISSIVYLDIPSYELRAISQLLHPDDPELTAFEKQSVTYINTIHSYFHSHFKAVVPAVVYYIIEEFDNSPPGRSGKGKRGLRVV
jgi:hypothetical protein